MKYKEKGYKGFDKELKCQGKQYAVGESAEEKEARLCQRGIHWCENPLDVFSYYRPNESRYCEISAEDTSDEKERDSKRVSKKIHVEAEIGWAGIVKAGVKFVFSLVKAPNAAHAATTGNWAHAATTGNWAHAATTGNAAHAATTGNEAHAATTGNAAHAATTGNEAHAATTGDACISAALGKFSRAKAALGGWLVLVEYEDNKPKDVQARKVDGETVKADTWYALTGGEFVECAK